MAAQRSFAVLIALYAGAGSQSAIAQAPLPPIRTFPAPAAPVLDPESPIADLPDIGVDWPRIDPDPESSLPQVAAPAANEKVARRYKVVLEGVQDVQSDQLLPRFDALSLLKAGEGKSANVAQIDRRARDDLKLLGELLRAAGYYDAKVTMRVEPSKAGDRLDVIMSISPGPLYRFSEVRVQGLDATTEKGRALREAFTIAPHDPVNADDVAAAEARLKIKAVRGGFPFAEIGQSDVDLDHETRTAVLTLIVATGGERKIGQIIVKGDRPPFGAKHVATLGRFTPGDPYDQAQVDDLKRAVIATGLVSSVRIEPIIATKSGDVDLVVSTEPAPLRTIAAEFGYSTGEGLKGEVSWTHRNLIKPEGAVTVRAVAGTQEQSFGALIRMNNFGARDRVLSGRVLATNINRNAFDARTLEIGGNLELQTNLIWQKKWVWSVGGELILTDERDVVAAGTARRTFVIGALPLTLAYDGSDDLLDPHRGFRLSGRVSPEFSFLTGTNAYVRAQIDGSVYQPVGARTVIAARARFGAIIGSSSRDIAPSRRFYAGGGNSIRGYGYQRIGPRDRFNDPVGGRSVTEFALEARVRFGDFSIVPFLDAGTVSSQSTPQFDTFRFGAGLGLRYHSNFGPIRIDFGTPLNPQTGDSPITVTVSLGQAF
jgi:translocation and assembly module TamA